MMDALLVLEQDMSADAETVDAIEFRTSPADKGFTPRRAWLRAHIKELAGAGTFTLSFRDSPDGTTYTTRAQHVFDLDVADPALPSVGSDLAYQIPTNHEKFVKASIASVGLTYVMDVDIIAG